MSYNNQQQHEDDTGEDYDQDIRFSNMSDPRNSMQQYNTKIRETTGPNNYPAGNGYAEPQQNRARQGANGDHQGKAAGIHTSGGQRNINFDCADGRPLQLVAADPKTGQFSLNTEAFEVSELL